MSDVIVIAIILAVIAAAIIKIRIEKKKGTKCIGCPYSGSKDIKCNCHSSK